MFRELFNGTTPKRTWTVHIRRGPHGDTDNVPSRLFRTKHFSGRFRTIHTEQANEPPQRHRMNSVIILSKKKKTIENNPKSTITTLHSCSISVLRLRSIELLPIVIITL